MIKQIRYNLEIVEKTFGDKLWLVNNKALMVSMFLFVSKLINERRSTLEVERFSEFFAKLIKTIRWQIPLGVTMDQPYTYIALDFQTYVTQAADEKRAIEKREEFLAREFDYFTSNRGMIRGDFEYEVLRGKSADSVRDSLFLGDLRSYH